MNRSQRNSISESQPHKASAGSGNDDFQRFRDRLESVTEGTHPLVDIENGTKESYQQHQYEENRLTWSEVEGNCAIMPVNNLAFVDVDEPDEVPDVIRALPETLRVDSPHGGYHLYFRCNGELENSKFDWGEVRVDTWYVMAPGSVIDHDGYCGDDCSHSGESRYELSQDREPARITPEQLPDPTASETAQSVQQEEVEFDSVDVDFHIKSRIEKAKNAKHGEQFTALWEGRYRDAGYSDRSTAEADLLCRLAFWLEKDEKAMACAMDIACSEHPRTDGMSPRKWLERDGVYRETSLKSATATVDNEYSGSTSGTYRPTVSKLTKDAVFEALMDLKAATSTEIAEHDATDRSKRQIQNALKEYDEQDVIDWTKDGRQVYYYIADCEEFIPDGQRAELGL
ncbi:bifunctional DNA primase/polymerase [Halomicrococcus gelatinilyticus]|uniref:bifunctional DNA primase/polymerase n=1 Tax=Halomicrococcus gelatinilyticus TaxID=1702103 RepID=UPI002E13D49F